MIRVSVIIPVYNTEQYLRECLESVVSQTLTEIEIICVNDGSPDSSGDILGEFAGRDDRIVVIDQENLGLSGARNAGVAVARGEYLHFLDSDDYLELNALAELHELATLDELDVLYFDGAPFFEDPAMEKAMASYAAYYVRNREYPQVMSGQALLTEMSEFSDHRPSACLQLIRRDFYTAAGLSFIEGIVHEDNPFSFVCALKANRVRYVPEPYYRRRVRKGSITTVDKGMAHFRGFFIGHLAMLRFVIGGTFDPETSVAIEKLVIQMFRQAFAIYLGLSKEEKASITLIDQSPEGLLTCSMLIRQGNDTANLNRLKRELEATTKKLEKIQNSRSHRAAKRLRRLLRFRK